MKSILRYAGGKSRVAPYLIGCFPKHHLYVDMFCGMLSVTLAKPLGMSPVEWINDKYNDVANFFMVIKSMPDEFLKAFRDEYVFDSEYMYRYWVERMREPYEIPDVLHAVMFWMVQKQTFSGRNALASTSYSFYSQTASTGRHPATLPRRQIRALHDRLVGVQVFNRDFRHIYDMVSGKTANKPSTFIFEDPPYWDTAGMYDYKERFSWDDHQELAERNLSTGCRWLLTINDHDDIRGLYEGKEGVHIRKYDITYSVNVEMGPRQTHEIMVTNFDTEQQFGPLFQMGG